MQLIREKIFEALLCQRAQIVVHIFAILASLHATAIPSRKHSFSSDQESQTGLGSTFIRLSDRPGTLSAVVSPFVVERLSFRCVAADNI